MKKSQPMILVEGHGYVPCEPAEATHLMLHLPGPLPNRVIPVMIKGKRDGTPNWTWNGSVEKPTLRPSVLTKGGTYENGQHVEHVCHSWIAEGMVQFLGDCTHEFAGKTVELLDVD